MKIQETKVTYKTISKNSTHTLEEKKSKFITYTYKVSNQKQIKEIIKKTKKEHPKSNHTPYAFKIGIINQEIGFSDDGEPTGSAGKPIYFEIKGKQITNTLIIVVRYFGGIKLGVGGLTKTFSQSAKQALENTQIIEKPITKEIKIKFEYNIQKEIENIIIKNQIEIIIKKYETNCEYKIEIPILKYEKVTKELKYHNIKMM